METESPAPYIAMGTLEAGKVDSETNDTGKRHKCVRTMKLIIEVLITIGAIMVTIHLFKIMCAPNPENFLIVMPFRLASSVPEGFKDQNLKQLIEGRLANQEIRIKYLEEEVEEPMYMTEYEELKMYRMNMAADDYGIKDIVWKLCRDMWPEDYTDDMKEDPQFWTNDIRNDYEFCSTLFKEYDEEH